MLLIYPTIENSWGTHNPIPSHPAPIVSLVWHLIIQLKISMSLFSPLLKMFWLKILGCESVAHAALFNASKFIFMVTVVPYQTKSRRKEKFITILMIYQLRTCSLEFINSSKTIVKLY